MFMQLNPPVPLETPKGKAWAIALIDYGPQWDLQWITFLHDSGECWTFLNRDIRQEANFTFGIGEPSAITPQKPAMPRRTSTNAADQNSYTVHALNGNGTDDNEIAYDYAQIRRPKVNGHA